MAISVIPRSPSGNILEGGNLVRLVGIWTIVVGVVLGLLLFALPNACSVVGGFQLLFAVGMFLLGLFILAFGQVLVWREKRNGTRPTHPLI